jgi:HEAT repeat protein
MTPNLPPVQEAVQETPRDRLARLAAHVGERRAAELCAEVLAAHDPHDNPEMVLFLGGAAGRSILEGGGWGPDYWTRVWGARGLLYVWDEAVSPVVLDGLGDGAWRVAEMCLKVSALRELPAADDAVLLAGHDLPRVRAAAIRVLGACGDTEHVEVAVAGLDDPELEVRKAAARSVDALQRRLDLPPLR